MTEWAENTVGFALLTSVMPEKGSLAQPVTLRQILLPEYGSFCSSAACGQVPELDFS